jgi:small subunit ribosomal protein S17
VPEKKKTTTRKTTTRKTAAAKPAAAGRVASGRGSRPRRPTVKAGAAAASYETRLPSTRPAAAGEARVHRGARKTRVGRVASAKTPRTVIVVIERLREHPLYKKTIKVRKRVPAHDAQGDVKAGDLVRIQESRPFSATKRWQVIEVISRAGEAFAAAPEAADVEHALEEIEGVRELLAKPERETPEAAAEETAGGEPGAEEERR